MTKNHTYALTKRRKKSPIFIEPSFPSPACLADDFRDVRCAARVVGPCLILRTIVVRAAIEDAFRGVLVPDVRTHAASREMIATILILVDHVQAAYNTVVNDRAKVCVVAALQNDQVVNSTESMDVVIDQDQTVVGDLVCPVIEDDDDFRFLIHGDFPSEQCSFYSRIIVNM